MVHVVSAAGSVVGADWIIQYGKMFIGCHYLWGAAGATPDGQDGSWYRPGSVNMDRPSSTNPGAPSIFAATCDVEDHFVCAGNFKRTRDGDYAHSSDKELTDYLSSLAAQPSESFWCPYKSRLTPRVVKGKNVDPDKGRAVWGEDCRYVRHFDCIGFVNFVLSLTTSQRWGFSISQYAAGNVTPAATAIPLDASPADADIVIINPTHIGFLCADGQVLQAQDHAHGVHADETYKGKPDHPGAKLPWTARFRVPPGIINASGVTTWGNGGTDTRRW